jgi:hypothetical protein
MTKKNEMSYLEFRNLMKNATVTKKGRVKENPSIPGYSTALRGKHAVRASDSRRAAVEQGFRSNLELRVSIILKNSKIRFRYEPYTLDYEVPAKRCVCTKCRSKKIVKKHRYKPDFVLRHNVILEVKGNFTRADQVKMLAVKKANPKYRIVFVSQNPKKKTTPKGPMTYEDWAIKYEFEYIGIKDFQLYINSLSF